MVPNWLTPVAGLGEMQPWIGVPSAVVFPAGHAVEVAAADAYSECVVFTPVTMTLLSRLKASPTTCMRMRSWMGMSRVIRKSTFLNPGPMMLLRPICGGRPVVAPPDEELIAPP